MNYYRLAVTNFEGETRYSDIILNRRPGVSRKLDIFPRPSHDETNISIREVDDNVGITGIKVFDINGRLLITKNVFKSTKSTIYLTDQALNSGLYLVAVELSDGTMLHDKLIKK